MKLVNPTALTLLNFWYAAYEVVETLGFGLGTICGEGQVMVLEVETYAGEIDDRLDASLLEFLGVT